MKVLESYESTEIVSLIKHSLDPETIGFLGKSTIYFNVENYVEPYIEEIQQENHGRYAKMGSYGN